MHIFFSGIGGAGIGPLAIVAQQAGYEVSGSDKQPSQYIEYLKREGVTAITIGQTADSIAHVHRGRPIDWFVYSSAVAIEQPDSPEFQFCHKNGIKMSKRDELINVILQDKQMKLVAIAGTHGKTTTTAMCIWLLQQLRIPISYILPAKSNFADMGHYDAAADYFVYECDEYDRNFLQFRPTLSLITGIDWDHPDIYPERDDYYQAFRQFIEQSDAVTLWQSDVNRLGGEPSEKDTVLPDSAEKMRRIRLAGDVNRRDAFLVAHSLAAMTGRSLDELISVLEKFPGVSRRFEKIQNGLFSDYAHTPAKIKGALQLGTEVSGDNLVVVYEGLHNTRQHFIRQELSELFDGVKRLYIVPSYLAREDESLEIYTPEKLRSLLSPGTQSITVPSGLDTALRLNISEHLAQGDTVLCLSAGGGGSLDEWLRREFIRPDPGRAAEK